MFRWLSDLNYRTLKRRIDALEGDLEQLQGQHRALRSTFYASRGSPKGPPEPPLGSREQRDQVLTEFLAGKVKHGS